MSNRLQKYVAPIVVLVVILALWEGLVAALQIEKFLLPRPSVILANFAQVFIFEPEAASPESSESKPRLTTDRLFVRLPTGASSKALETALAGKIAQFSLFGYNIVVVTGANFAPIVQASLFTLREALGGFAIGCTLGILTAFATARWTITREAFMPFAIAANSTPIIAFAPIM
ncbi:MAG TPA: hypothetical protein VEC93_08280, partial [Anaerolineae bacterium]|nr:hypothetical protein [Anaerolineae bacterium]